MDPIELLAPYLLYIEVYWPALTLAGLLTSLTLDRLPIDWYEKQSENAQFWIASLLGAATTILAILVLGDIVPEVALPTTLGAWALVLIAGALGPKVFYHLGEAGNAVVARLEGPPA